RPHARAAERGRAENATDTARARHEWRATSHRRARRGRLASSPQRALRRMRQRDAATRARPAGDRSRWRVTGLLALLPGAVSLHSRGLYHPEALADAGRA